MSGKGNIVKIKPSALSEKHIGRLCVIHFTTHGTGFVGHSQRYGLEEGNISTSYILVGRLQNATEKELNFVDCHYSRHAFDMSWSLGPRLKSTPTFTVKRKDIHTKTKIVLNNLEYSNSVMQHLLKANKKEHWGCARRLAVRLKESRAVKETGDTQRAD